MNLFSHIIFHWISPLYSSPDPKLVSVSRKISAVFRGNFSPHEGKGVRVPPLHAGGHRAAGTHVLSHRPLPRRLRTAWQQPARLTHAELCSLLFSELSSSSEEVSILRCLSSNQCFLSFSLVTLHFYQIASG